MAFILPPLPYAENALEPHISARTMSFHYGKHHQTYVNTLNDLTKGSPLAEKSIEEIITSSAKDKGSLFNNAAQVWNHTFFWHSMTPKGGGEPTGKLADLIKSSFGDLDQFKTRFKEAATTQFGSGWVWLIKDGNQLAITKTPNAENPLAIGQTALLTCDVWEHSYYLDYQNKRGDFVQVFLDKLIHWQFAAKNL